MTIEHAKTLAQGLEVQARVAREMLSRGRESTSTLGGVALTRQDEELLDRWISATACLIRDNLGHHEEVKFRDRVDDRDCSMQYRTPTGRCLNGAAFVESLVRVCRDFPSQLTYTEPALSRLSAPKDRSANAKGSSFVSRVVFLVHGHDESNAIKLQKHLREAHRLHAMILSDVAAKGRTLIEKFEEEARRCGYAFALLTPDDVVAGKEAPYAQARPNVAFELGWFYGQLGRARVCILFKRGTTMHSDLDGINRVEFGESVIEAASGIERELRASGLIN